MRTPLSRNKLMVVDPFDIHYNYERARGYLGHLLKTVSPTVRNESEFGPSDLKLLRQAIDEAASARSQLSLASSELSEPERRRQSSIEGIALAIDASSVTPRSPESEFAVLALVDSDQVGAVLDAAAHSEGVPAKRLAGVILAITQPTPLDEQTWNEIARLPTEREVLAKLNEGLPRDAAFVEGERLRDQLEAWRIELSYPPSLMGDMEPEEADRSDEHVADGYAGAEEQLREFLREHPELQSETGYGKHFGKMREAHKAATEMGVQPPEGPSDLPGIG